jgi:hypothetical protein
MKHDSKVRQQSTTMNVVRHTNKVQQQKQHGKDGEQQSKNNNVKSKNNYKQQCLKFKKKL